MMPTLLHAVARKAEAITPDAELLARYLREQDNTAFEELLRRHGPLVWAVCRQMLPHHADAEDAFQAVFLALVRSAAHIRDGRTVPAWLHGVAVRIATRAKREFARRRARERAAASPEAEQPLSDEAWQSLVAAVHEEVQKLPEAERTAFVLCDLQGVSQADAAVRLGWPLGSVSGRLCKARQWLLDRLSARGIAPAAFVGIGITSGAASAVPESVFNVVKTFPGVPNAASTVATALARGFVEGVTMRVKLMAVTAVVVAALSVTGGAVWLSKADAQPPGEPFGLPPVAVAAPPGVPGVPPTPPPPPRPGGTATPPGAPAGLAPGGAWAVAAPATWEYKFVDLRPDRKDYEKVITQHGKEGWEFVGSERFGGNELTLVFKKRKGGEFGFGVGTGAPAPAPGSPAAGNLQGLGVWRDSSGGSGIEVRSFTLKHLAAADIAAELKAFKGVKAAVADPWSNKLFVVADVSVMKDVTKIIEDLEAKGVKVETPRPTGSGPMGPGGPMGVPNPGFTPFSGPVPGFPGIPPSPPEGVKPNGIAVITLKYARADAMLTVLREVFPGWDMSIDSRTNSLIIRASEKSLEEVKALIAKLDVEVKPK
jgi:RNA polymerase sigma factor (sigma-70 family)